MSEFNKRGYLLENFRLFHLRDSGVQVDFHYHDFCKLLLLLSGSGGYHIEGQRYSLQPGDAVLLGPGMVHCPAFPEGQPYERVILYIDPEYLQEQSVKNCDLMALFGEHPVLHCGDRVLQLAAELEQELAENAYGSEVVSSGLLLRLLVEIAREHQGGRDNALPPMMPKDARFRELLEMIDTHPAEHYTVEALAERVYLSKFHFMRRFKEETGQSVHEYVTRRRLLLARDLIRQGENVTQVCFRVGFNSYSSFYRAYVKFFGITPTGKREGKARENGEE